MLSSCFNIFLAARTCRGQHVKQQYDDGSTCVQNPRLGWTNMPCVLFWPYSEHCGAGMLQIIFEVLPTYTSYFYKAVLVPFHTNKSRCQKIKAVDEDPRLASKIAALEETPDEEDAMKMQEIDMLIEEADEETVATLGDLTTQEQQESVLMLSKVSQPSILCICDCNLSFLGYWSGQANRAFRSIPHSLC